MQICDVLRQQLGALVSSYDILINCDNTLTTEGERSACIRNGIVLDSGGVPLPFIIAALKILEEPAGCSGIVERGLIGNVSDLPGIIKV